MRRPWTSDAAQPEENLGAYVLPIIAVSGRAVCPFCTLATDFAKKSRGLPALPWAEDRPWSRTGAGSLYIETLKPVRAVQVLHSASRGGTCMVTKVGGVTLWSIIAVVAIVIMALMLVNR